MPTKPQTKKRSLAKMHLAVCPLTPKVVEEK